MRAYIVHMRGCENQRIALEVEATDADEASRLAQATIDESTVVDDVEPVTARR